VTQKRISPRSDHEVFAAQRRVYRQHPHRVARCHAYGMKGPDFLLAAEKLTSGPDEAMAKPSEPEPPRDNESAHMAKTTTQDVEGGHE
jgi:hypothetical protein